MKKLSDEEQAEEEAYRRQHYSKFGVLGVDYVPKYDDGTPIKTKKKRKE